MKRTRSPYKVHGRSVSGSDRDMRKNGNSMKQNKSSSKMLMSFDDNELPSHRRANSSSKLKDTFKDLLTFASPDKPPLFPEETETDGKEDTESSSTPKNEAEHEVEPKTKISVNTKEINKKEPQSPQPSPSTPPPTKTKSFFFRTMNDPRAKDIARTIQR